MGCESSSLFRRSANIICDSSGEYVDAGFTLKLSVNKNNSQAHLSKISFAGEETLYNGKVKVMTTNGNSFATLVESKDRSLLIETKSSNALIMKINHKNITNSFANLSCSDSLAKYFN